MRLLVTGGAGFIGSNLVEALAASGHEVRVFDNGSTGSVDNLASISSAPILGDVRDRDAVLKAVSEVEVIYHLAALPSVARSVGDPITTHQVNVDGTLNVLEAARRTGVRRVVYASSSSVYGDTPRLPKDEGMPLSPQSPYAASKAAAEAYCRSFSHVYGLETVSLRFFNVFGPRQDPASEYAAVIPRFIDRMLAGSAPDIFGDGKQSRDFTYVSNVVEALQLAASAGPEAVGQAMNVGCGSRTTLLELVAAMNDLLGTAIQPAFSSPRPGDIKHSHADIAKAERLLGYRPRLSVRAGLGRTIDWFAGRRPMTEGAFGVSAS
jgi:UDP-N-acetylglucosamine/UDP-N-acetyl-alpha-D-glucosaminouronate 4-epimerase